MIFIPFFVFAFGLLIGSFLNVVILRMNTGRSVVTGRSKCARCNHVLHWYELIPVFSFLGLRGKCRTCHTGISFQYPLVELTTAITFAVLYTRVVVLNGFTQNAWIVFIYALSVASLLIVIMIYDLKHKIIPDSSVYGFILLALLAIVWKAVMFPQFLWGNALVHGILVALPFFLLWFFSKGTFMGFGDVKLALGMGWLLGLASGYTAIVLSFWVGGIIGLFLIVLSKKYSMKSQVPFAPFLIVAIAIVSIWGVTLSSLFPYQL